MLISNSRVFNTPIFSLQVGRIVARTGTPIIDPDNLKIVAFFTQGPLVDRADENILMASSIREFAKMGMIIDALDELVAKDDVIKIKKIIELKFNLVGLKVVTKKGVKLGKVVGFNLTADDLMVQQLVVKRPFSKSFLDPELIIPRSEIVEITDTKIIVKNETERKPLFSEQKIQQTFNREQADQLATLTRDNIEETSATE